MRIYFINRYKFSFDEIKYLMESIKYNFFVLCIVEVNEEYDELSLSVQKDLKLVKLGQLKILIKI